MKWQKGKCLNCKHTVIINSDGTCPNCGQASFIEVIYLGEKGESDE